MKTTLLIMFLGVLCAVQFVGLVTLLMGNGLIVFLTRKMESRYTKRTVVSIVAGILILAVAALAAKGLAMQRKPPEKVVRTERPLMVEMVEAQPEDIQVLINGFGEARALDSVAITPEVAGTIVELHPNLDVGEIIEGGELLFRIDTRDYTARVADAEATVAQLDDSIKRLQRQQAIDKDRLTTLTRSRELARAEFDRIKALFNEDQVGTQSAVDQSERAYNATKDQARQLQQAVELYPIRIREAKSSLESAKARLDLAKTNLDRTAVRAPFTARIKTVNVELDQYVTPGAPVLMLANDSVLELSVPLDSREAREWLQFSAEQATGEGAWFNAPETVVCDVRWTEARDQAPWKGRLHRVEQFDRMTRTLTVAIRVDASEQPDNDGMLPLVEGMFCAVSIPGRTLKNAFRVPSQAVSFDGTVYVANDSHLKTVTVDAPYSDGRYTYVASGLEPGDRVITTRLISPLEGALVKPVDQAQGGSNR